MKVTQWFDADTSPARPGKYECEIYNDRGVLQFVMMIEWKRCGWVPSMILTPNSQFGDRWRGLAEKPEGK
jgi:hypothetical protein